MDDNGKWGASGAHLDLHLHYLAIRKDGLDRPYCVLLSRRCKLKLDLQSASKYYQAWIDVVDGPPVAWQARPEDPAMLEPVKYTTVRHVIGI